MRVIRRPNVKLPSGLLVAIVGIPVSTIVLLVYMVWVIVQAACFQGEIRV